MLTNFEKSFSFKDIFTKIGGYLNLGLSHRLAKVKCKFFVCVSVSWFICSLKNEKKCIFQMVFDGGPYSVKYPTFPFLNEQMNQLMNTQTKNLNFTLANLRDMPR